MINAGIKILALVSIVTINSIGFSQEKIILSYQHNYLIARFTDPVETKFSPNWEKINNQDIAELVPTVPIGFPFFGNTLEENKESYFTILFSFLKGFIYEPHNYGDVDKDIEIMPYIISYGTLGNGNYTMWFYDKYPRMVDTLFKYFARSEEMTSLLLDYYLKPSVTWAISCMSEPTKNSYKSIIKESIKYINDLKSIAFLNTEIDYCKKQESFTYKNSNGEIDNYRKAKAFIFRRYIDFQSKNWSFDQINQFEVDTKYRPKPGWGINLEQMKDYLNLIQKWF
ncbi:MAG: hypothetical protein AB7S50_15390 [Bacteroidales bacterium]